jgi:hypothetical protein
MFTLLDASFPALISHTYRMREHLFDDHDRTSWPTLVTPNGRNWSSLIDVRQLLTGGNGPDVRRRAGQKERDALSRRRWTWIVITGVSLTSFAVWQGIVSVPGWQWATGWAIGGDIREEEDREDLD